MILFRLSFILLCMLSIGACKEDYSYPNVLTELAEVQTDENGHLKELTTDRGETFIVGKYASTTRFTADTLYRMLTVFEPLQEHPNQLLVHVVQPIFSEYPIPVKQLEDGIKTDPVDIQSIWRAGNYLNMILHIQTKEEPHKFHFVDHGIYPYDEQPNSDAPQASKGKQVLELTFYHDRKEDYEAFTSNYCFSIPLKPYEGKLKKGDVIRLHLNTYKEGATIREFEF